MSIADHLLEPNHSVLILEINNPLVLFMLLTTKNAGYSAFLRLRLT